MPAQPRVLGEGRSVGLLERELRPQVVVAAVEGGEEDVDRVDSTLEEDRDEDPPVRARVHRCVGDPVLEQPSAERPAPVHRDRQACRAKQQRAAREPRSRGRRHARLDGRKALAGLRDGAAEELGAREVVTSARAALGHAVCSSGAAAISWRRLASISPRARPRAIERFANRRSTSRLAFPRGGLPQNASARSTRSVALAPLGASAGDLPSAVAAKYQRPRNVAVSSHWVSSQPATFGGRKSRWPAASPRLTQERVSMPRPTARNMPAAYTVGGFTIRGPV